MADSSKADKEPPAPQPPARAPGGCGWAVAAAVVGMLVLGAAGGGVFLGRFTAPPASSSIKVVRASPNVLTAVRDLARLESVQFHMERVIDLRDEQSKLFGMVTSKDAILLIAAARVSAGVDLENLREQDIQVDHEQRSVKLRLPPVQIFDAALDNKRTYVHSRDTDFLADRNERLETKARLEAERQLVDAAKDMGILKQAEANAQRTLEGLLRSLGFEKIEIEFRAK